VRIAPGIVVDMMDNASALPTCPQRQQQKKTVVRKWSKITHTTSRRGQIQLNLLWRRLADIDDRLALEDNCRKESVMRCHR
jgi:hypothetical protein